MRVKNQQLIVLQLMEFLFKNQDGKFLISELTKILHTKYGYVLERKTINHYLTLLMDNYGVKRIKTKNGYRYYYGGKLNE